MEKEIIDRLALILLAMLNTESMILTWIAWKEENDEISDKFFEMAEENRKIIKREHERIDGLY